MVRRQSVVLAWFLAAFAALIPVRPVLACSPPFEPPTIEELGPAQVVVVVGTIGQRVAGGRLFHVERWFNGDAAVTPIVIAFKEGPAVGDCSYPVETGQHLIIAPVMEGGRLSADLGTLQADPATAAGQRYVEEATRLFGPGVPPVPTAAASTTPLSTATSPLSSAPRWTLPVAIAVAIGAGALAAMYRIGKGRVRRGLVDM
jgi:hypothetical protein